MENFDTEAMDGRASPRKPSVEELRQVVGGVQLRRGVFQDAKREIGFRHA